MKKTVLAMIFAMLLFGGVGIGFQLNDIVQNHQIMEVSDTLRIINGEAWMQFNWQQINWKAEHAFQRDMNYIRAAGVTKLHLQMDTPGGMCLPAWGIYDTLRTAINNRLYVHAHVNGSCASMGIPMFLICQERTMGDSAMMMIHAHSGIPTEFKSPGENAMYERWTDLMIRAIVENTDMSLEKAKMHCSTGLNQRSDAFYLDKPTALEYGFITHR